MGAADAGRVGWVDTAKGTAILLVVLPHAYMVARMTGDFPAWLAALNQRLGNIRMPLFFLASGLLMGRLVERPWPQLVRKRIAPLAWVLLLWTVIGSAINLGLRLYPWDGDPLPGVAQALWLPQGNLWFVHALLVFAVLARIAAIASGWRRVVLAAGLWLALLGYDLWREEFHTRNMVQFFPFFVAGVLAAEPIKRATASWQGLALIAGVSLAGLTVLSLAGVGGLAGKAGCNVFGVGLFVVAAAAIQPWLCLTRWLDAAGRNSLAIFLGHVPVLAVAFVALPLQGTSPVIAWIALFVLAVAGAVLMEHGAQRLRLGWIYRMLEPMADWAETQSSRVLAAGPTLSQAAPPLADLGLGR